MRRESEKSKEVGLYGEKKGIAHHTIAAVTERVRENGWKMIEEKWRKVKVQGNF